MHRFGARPPLGLHPRLGDGRNLNEPLDGEFDGIGVVFNMATDTVIVLNVIPSGPERQGGRRGGRPHRAHQRFAGGRTTDRPARDHAPAARQTRLGGAAGPRTARHRRTGGGDGRARQDPDPQPHGGTDAHRRHRLRQTGPVRPHLAHRTARKALSTLRTAGNAQTDPRPAGQFGRVPRPGDRHRQRVPARRQTDRLYRRPQPPAHRTIQRRHGQCRRPRPGGARRRGKRLVERNPRRSVAGQRPRNDHRPPFVRQGARPTADSLRRRFGAAADRRPLLHPHGALDPETLHLGRRRELRRRHLEPLPAQRVLLGRFDPFRRRARAAQRRAARWSTAAAASCPTSSYRSTRPT